MRVQTQNSYNHVSTLTSKAKPQVLAYVQLNLILFIYYFIGC